MPQKAAPLAGGRRFRHGPLPEIAIRKSPYFQGHGIRCSFRLRATSGRCRNLAGSDGEVGAEYSRVHQRTVTIARQLPGRTRPARVDNHGVEGIVRWVRAGQYEAELGEACVDIGHSH